MNVKNKHLATFLLGAAAAFGAYKYMKLTDEEKEKLANDLKDKANRVKTQAIDAEEKAMEYFAELKTKGSESLQEYLPKMEEFFANLFKGGKSGSDGTTGGNGTTAGTGSMSSGPSAQGGV